MRSGISFSVSAVTRLGSPRERDYMLEVGLWPYRSKHNRLWLSVMVSGEGRSDYLNTWALHLPKPSRLLRKVEQWWYKRDETENV